MSRFHQATPVSARAVLTIGLLALVSLSFTHRVHRTAQEPDIILIDGDSLFIYTNPLEPFLSEHPEKRPEPDVVSTSNWRGYIATWEVRDNHLLLVDVTVEVEKRGGGSWDTEQRSVMQEMFLGRSEVAADWFSGFIVVPTGEPIDYVHMGYGTTYDSYTLLRVVDGAVERMWDADAEAFAAFRQEQFERFKETDEYRAAIEELREEEGLGTADWLEGFMFEFYSADYMAILFDE